MPRAACLPQGGRWLSRTLGLDLSIEGGRLRFYSGSAALLDAEELIERLSAMVDEAIRRAEQEAARAEHEAARAEHEAVRAQEETQRAERLAAKLRELGIDPDAIE